MTESARHAATILELLALPEHWTKNCFAQDANGIECSIKNTTAYSFCLLGAAQRVYPVDEISAFSLTVVTAPSDDIVCALAEASGIRTETRRITDIRADIAAWNDNPARTFADVRAMLEKAGV